MNFDNFEYLPKDLFFSKSLVGKECQRCKSALPYDRYNRDSTTRDGRANVCPKCLAAPRENTADAYARIRESNLNSETIKSQRRPDEEFYQNRDSVGRSLYHSDFITLLKKLLGPRLIVAPAFFANEFSLYVQDASKTDSNGVQYVGFIEQGKMQEFSSYRYNEYGVPVDETRRGYRGLLMRLILSGYTTEDQVKKVFGPCDEKVWCKTLYNWRNHKAA